MSEFSDHEGGDDGGFGEESYDGDDHQNQGQGGQETENVISNQHYDEVVQLSDDDGDDVATPEQSNVSASKGYADAHDEEDHDGGSEEHDGEEDDEEQDEDEHEDTTPAGRNAGPIQNPRSGQPQSLQQMPSGTRVPPKPIKTQPTETASDEDAAGSSEEEEEEEDDEEGYSSSPGKSGYNPADYADLPVSQEIKEIFQYIARYKPQTIEVETRLKPFVPDYIPCIGDIDAFIKIGRPDDAREMLGLVELDEPSSKQSDPTVFDLQLRAVSKQAGTQPATIRSIENAARNPKAISSWVNSVNELHRSKPRDVVHYSRQMPDLESLMQIWPSEVEEILNTVNMPTAEVDLDVKGFSQLACGLVDIPIHSKGPNVHVESLHLLFSLFSEFKYNQHFQGMGAGSGDGFGDQGAGFN